MNKTIAKLIIIGAALTGITVLAIGMADVVHTTLSAIKIM